MTDTIQTDAPAPITKPENQAISEIPLQPIFTQSTQDIWRSSGIIPLIDQDQQRLNKDWLTKGVIDFDAASNPYGSIIRVQDTDVRTDPQVKDGDRHAFPALSDRERQILLSEINMKPAQKPEDVLKEILAKSDVIAFGEHHDLERNDTREFLTRHMKLLKEEGVTHLGVESSTHLQPALDWYNSVPKSPENDRRLEEWLKELDDNGTNYLEVYKAAKAQGINLFVVDTDQKKQGDLSSDTREQQMAQNTLSVLKSPDGITPLKVVILQGGDHVHKSTDPRSADFSAVDLIQREGYRVTSIYAGVHHQSKQHPLIPLAQDLNAPTFVRPDQHPILSALKTGTREHSYRGYDYIFLQPRK